MDNILSQKLRQDIEDRIVQKTGGQIIIRTRVNTREQQMFYIAYVLPSGALDRIPRQFDGTEVIAWAAAETKDESLLRLANSIGIPLST